jgi:hypothetical protein
VRKEERKTEKGRKNIYFYSDSKKKDLNIKRKKIIRERERERNRKKQREKELWICGLQIRLCDGRFRHI